MISQSGRLGYQLRSNDLEEVLISFTRNLHLVAAAGKALPQETRDVSFLKPNSSDLPA